MFLVFSVFSFSACAEEEVVEEGKEDLFGDVELLRLIYDFSKFKI